MVAAGVAMTVTFRVIVMCMTVETRLFRIAQRTGICLMLSIVLG